MKKLEEKKMASPLIQPLISYIPLAGHQPNSAVVGGTVADDQEDKHQNLEWQEEETKTSGL